MLIAISAPGLGTSLTAIAALGWRHVATVINTTLVILVVVTAGLMLLAWPALEVGTASSAPRIAVWMLIAHEAGGGPA